MDEFISNVLFLNKNAGNSPVWLFSVLMTDVLINHPKIRDASIKFCRRLFLPP